MSSATATVVRGSQYMVALERANEVRLARAELKRQVADGRLTVDTVVLTSPWKAHSMEIADLLMAQRRWGRTRTRRFLAGIPMSESKTIGSMTDRQRTCIAERLASLREGIQPVARDTRTHQQRQVDIARQMHATEAHTGGHDCEICRRAEAA